MTLSCFRGNHVFNTNHILFRTDYNDLFNNISNADWIYMKIGECIIIVLIFICFRHNI